MSILGSQGASILGSCAMSIIAMGLRISSILGSQEACQYLGHRRHVNTWVTGGMSILGSPGRHVNTWVTGRMTILGSSVHQDAAI
jgi:hypothetical protein